MSQALRELSKLEERLDGESVRVSRPMTEVELARAVSFAINRAAHGAVTPAQAQDARRLHFTLFGTPEIGTAKFGPKDCKPIVCFDGGKPNQLASPEPLQFGFWQ